MISNQLRLLASGNNQRGDLLTRLAKDLFFALGYDDLRLDVHRSGRELDIQGTHRLEPRRVVAECKAHSEKIGGSDLNKFFGVLNRERIRAAEVPVTGYFVSLSGFTETAIDQEIESGNDRAILLRSKEIIEQLISTRVVVSLEIAIDRAANSVARHSLSDALVDSAELVGHDIGYIWIIYYSHGKERTHFALVHADGTPLSKDVAGRVIDADAVCGGSLAELTYVAPEHHTAKQKELAEAALAKYKIWLSQECGYIQLDGLPADKDLSATRLKLERLFVPLRASYLPEPFDSEEQIKNKSEEVLPIGHMLRQSQHLAVLAIPGGGKSTLLKRLATAYAFPERLAEVADELPAKSWLPVVIRCRELKQRSHLPIGELVLGVSQQAGLSSEEAEVFGRFLHDELGAGRVLLLVDGLDEISNEGDRKLFANNLRTFTAIFPSIGLVVTSREAGFRMVAGVIASTCKQARLAFLQEADVMSLCERWHVVVVADSEVVRKEARQLAREIWGNGSIRTLAENPLLLTTLLVVKRNIRELPSNRTALYKEAIKVLVRTWNVEGYAPLDEDETLAQLSYIACVMMEQGKQRVGQKSLLSLLRAAKTELEAELQFTKISPSQFVERIEYRSSLLLQAGHDHIDGELQPVFEFRHLTFQEYLAARGYVEEQYRGREQGKGLVETLSPHFSDPRWREVITLSASLAGRKCEPIISELIRACSTPRIQNSDKFELDPLSALLRECIIAEVQLPSPVLKAALHLLAASGHMILSPNTEILNGKFGEFFQAVVFEAYLAGGDDFLSYMSSTVDVASYRIGVRFPDREGQVDVAAQVAGLRSASREEIVCAAITLMHEAYRLSSPFGTAAPSATELSTTLPLLFEIACSNDEPCAVAAAWALAWVGATRERGDSLLAPMLIKLFEKVRLNNDLGVARFFAWALAAQPLLDRDAFGEQFGDCSEALLAMVATEHEFAHQLACAALTVGWYRRRPWTDDQLIELIEQQPEGNHRTWEILERMGDRGLMALERVREVSRKEREQEKGDSLD